MIESDRSRKRGRYNDQIEQHREKAVSTKTRREGGGKEGGGGGEEGEGGEGGFNLQRRGKEVAVEQSMHALWLLSRMGVIIVVMSSSDSSTAVIPGIICSNIMPKLRPRSERCMY